MPAAPEGPVAEIESQIRAVHGPDASGFALLDRNEDALRWWLALPISTAEQSAGRTELIERLDDTDALARFPIAPQSWSAELSALQDNLHVDTSRIYAERPATDAIEHVMLERIQDMLGAARQEVLIVNAYIIPRDRGITLLRELEDRGVKTKIPTSRSVTWCST